MLLLLAAGGYDGYDSSRGRRKGSMQVCILFTHAYNEMAMRGVTLALFGELH